MFNGHKLHFQALMVVVMLIGVVVWVVVWEIGKWLLG
jgi:hypothetical protein